MIKTIGKVNEVWFKAVTDDKLKLLLSLISGYIQLTRNQK